MCTCYFFLEYIWIFFSFLSSFFVFIEKKVPKSAERKALSCVWEKRADECREEEEGTGFRVSFSLLPLSLFLSPSA